MWVCSWSLFEKWYTSKPHLCHKTFPLRIICENLSNFETIDNSNSFKWLFGIIIEIFIPTNILDLLLFCWLVCWGFIYLNLVNFTKLLCMFLIKTKNLNVTWKNKSHFSSITFTPTDTLWKITPKNKWPTPFRELPLTTTTTILIQFPIWQTQRYMQVRRQTIKELLSYTSLINHTFKFIA